MDKRNHSDTQVSDLEEEINKQKLELVKIIVDRTKGAILRFKTKWYNEGEKNTKYFLNLEKRHYKQSTIGEIKIGDNTFVTSDGHILNECASFYKNCLYESKSTTGNLLDTSVFFSGENSTALKEHEQNACEGLLSEKEYLEALNTMESEKLQARTLINALNFAYETGQLSSQRKMPSHTILRTGDL